MTIDYAGALQSSLSISHLERNMCTPETIRVGVTLLQEASNPKTMSERLRELFSLFPLEVAANPNLSAEDMQKVMSDFPDLNSGTFFYSSTEDALAVIWQLQENPAFLMLQLENPGHPLFPQLQTCSQKLRIRYQLTTLHKNQLGFAFIQSLKPFLVPLMDLNTGFLRVWLFHVSALWRHMNGLEIPQHYGFTTKKELPVSGAIPPKIASSLESLRDALKSAARREYKRAFLCLFDCIEKLPVLLPHYPHILETLDAASLDRTWPDPTEELLHTIMNREPMPMVQRLRARLRKGL